MSNIFRAYDIRGAYPEELNEGLARKIGGAYVRYLKARTIVVGRDMRLSSPGLARAFIEGALQAGAEVTDIGMVTTPRLYHVIGEGHFDGGAMVTASHLPAAINGFKLCRENAIPLSGDHGLPEIERLVQADTPAAEPAKMGNLVKEKPSNRYVEDLATFVHQPVPLHIVVDAGNGMAGDEIAALFKKVPAWRLTAMYMHPDGHFPHHVANPLIEANTEDLQARVVKEKADLGVAFDGDADRCGFVDEQGRRIPEDLVTALIAQSLLSQEPGATILYDLRSSHTVPETISQAGGHAERCRVGHSFIKARMRETNALFAGELSGHYYFRTTGFTDNAVFAMIQMLNLLALKRQPVSQLIKPLQKYFKSGEINIKVTDKQRVFKLFEEHYQKEKTDLLDGLTVTFSSWWFNLRASNTESVLRLNMEASTDSELEEMKKGILNAIKHMDQRMAVVS